MIRRIEINPSTISFEEIPITVHYLEQPSPTPSVAALPENVNAVLWSTPRDVHEYRSLYYSVGEKWNWLDRIFMEDEALNEAINNDKTSIYLFQYLGETIGYIELVELTDAVEIQYFGLFPEHTGKGWGPALLHWVINKAAGYGKPKIQLNTCSLDHPKALQVYKKAGFVEIKQEFPIRKRRIN